MSKPKIRVAIIGTGHIGTDLCARMLLDDSFDVRAFAGRRNDSPGLAMLKGKVPHLISNGIEGLLEVVDEIDGVFDATSAFDHKAHWLELSSRGKWMIDLTPSQIGSPLVPELLGKNLDMQISPDVVANYSMVTCGGQSSAPLVYAIAAHSSGISEVEVSSSIAALSAGPATRRNIDQYVQSTENLVQLISGCEKVKSILVLNPAEPPVMMRTTVQMKVEKCDLEKIRETAREIVEQIKQYVPGYDLVVEPYLNEANIVSATVKVTGAGYVLPEYAGNLDIINAAAVQTAKIHAQRFLPDSVEVTR
jgi:acetaldehyde dehydrogenase